MQSKDAKLRAFCNRQRYKLNAVYQWIGIAKKMTTFFDIATVACFVGLVIAFFQFTDRETRTLVHFILAGVVFAVANQVGNAGSIILASILIFAGAIYAVLAARA